MQFNQLAPFSVQAALKVTYQGKFPTYLNICMIDSDFYLLTRISTTGMVFMVLLHPLYFGSVV
jgi:hypothetical protein